MLRTAYLLLLTTLCFFTSINAQNDSLDMEQLDNYDDDSFSPVSGVYFNDIWGYTDDGGNEYAIMGGSRHVFFFDVTDPENIVLIRKVFNGDTDITGNVDLDPSVWRDFKTFGDKAYGVADGNTNEGLTVYDLSQLPDTVLIEDQITTWFTRSHNIYIDEETGYLYTAGARLNSTYKDLIVLDLNTDPIELVADVSLDGGYIHDLYVVDDTAYCNSGNDGLFVFDVVDPANPDFVGSLESYTNSGYNHSCWRTEDGTHLVFCDETPGRQVKMLDVTDPANLSNADITDQFFSNLLNPSSSSPGTSMAHNPFIVGDLVYIAYYDNGVQVFDISDPSNVVVHAYYDTNDNTTYGHDGVWGVYPFFESGTLIASDIENGLFTLRIIEENLPVEWLSFTARPAGEQVELSWATASERNSSLFEIERSTNGIDFYKIGELPASGNSNERIDYQAFDENPLLGLNYYRLKQTDLDGTFDYSEIVTLRFTQKGMSIAPTLIDDSTPLNVFLDNGNSELFVKIFTVNGQHIRTLTFDQPGDLVQIPVFDLQNGVYIVQLQQANLSLSERVLIAR